jgi:alpha-N-arabinofuranosidase
VQEAFCSWRDDFSTETLHPRWSWVYAPDRSKYSFKNGLTLTGSKDTLSDIGSPTFLGTRQVQFDMNYETTVRIKEGTGAAGITVFHTKDHHYDLLVKKSGSGLAVQLRRHAADMEVRSRTVLFENTDTLTLHMDARRMGYTFFAGKDAAHLMEIGRGSSQLLSTEMMICTFTGCFAGMFAEGNVKAEFAYFSAEEK